MNQNQALEGIKVLEFCWAGAGPWATKHLADHGAQVIKLESTKRVDLIRMSMPFKNGIIDPDYSPLFIHFNTSKYSITMDLKHTRGLEIVSKLVNWSDVVVENFSPGVMEKLGLNYEQLIKIKPEIIMVSLSLMGQTGPLSHLPGYGHMAAALAGHTHMTGWADRPPVVPGSIVYADLIQPLFAVIAIMAALDYRGRTGKGQHIDVSQLELMVHMLAPAILNYNINGRVEGRKGNRCDHGVPHGVFRCKGDDNWCAIAVFNEDEWKDFCRVLDEPWVREDRFASATLRKQQEDELERLVEQWTMKHTAHDVMEMMQAIGVAAGIVQNAEDLLDWCPQLKHRESFVKLNHPTIGVCNHPNEPFKLSKTPAAIRTAPRLGEHNEEICTNILGMSEEELTELQLSGALE